MSDEARELLKRLVAWEEHRQSKGVELPISLAAIVKDARALLPLLAREQDGPVALNRVEFMRDETGWFFKTGTRNETARFTVGIPVPRALYAPDDIIGSVVENQEGTDAS